MLLLQGGDDRAAAAAGPFLSALLSGYPGDDATQERDSLARRSICCSAAGARWLRQTQVRQPPCTLQMGCGAKGGSAAGGCPLSSSGPGIPAARRRHRSRTAPPPPAESTDSGDVNREGWQQR